jgi:hypothetical protein
MQENRVAAALAPEKNIGVPMPSSWNYGSFHPNSRFFGAVMHQMQVRKLKSVSKARLES